jgi:hypothetical protein
MVIETIQLSSSFMTFCTFPGIFFPYIKSHDTRDKINSIGSEVLLNQGSDWFSININGIREKWAYQSN